MGDLQPGQLVAATGYGRLVLGVIVSIARDRDGNTLYDVRTVHNTMPYTADELRPADVPQPGQWWTHPDGNRVQVIGPSVTEPGTECRIPSGQIVTILLGNGWRPEGS